MDRLHSISQQQQERLFYIEFRLYFFGTVNRFHVEKRFNVKVASASRDLQSYLQLAPNNTQYDKNSKTYLRLEGFTPIFTFQNNPTLAGLLHGFGDDCVSVGKPIIPTDAPTQISLPKLPILATITQAIYEQKALTVDYHSLSSGKSTKELVPFALVDNGLRWHLRSYDRLKERFADFVINRINRPKIIESDIPEEQSKAADHQWNRMVDLHLVPHPNLKHPDTIALEYGMTDNMLKVQVRAAVVGYLLRKWNVDCSENHSLQGPEYHLWLQNTPTLYGVENLHLASGYNNTGKNNES